MKTRTRSYLAREQRVRLVMRSFMGLFVFVFIATMASLGGEYAMALCMFPAIVILTLFPYGAASLVSVLKKRKHDSVFESIYVFLKEGAPGALFCCAQKGFAADTARSLSCKTKVGADQVPGSHVTFGAN